MKKIGKIVGTFIKGGLRANPLGNVIVKGIEAVRGKDLVTGEPVKPINWQLIIVEVLGVLVLGYLVVKGIIPVDQLIKFLQQFI